MGSLLGKHFLNLQHLLSGSEKVGIQFKVTSKIQLVRYFESDQVQRDKCKKFTGQSQNAAMQDGERWTLSQYGSPVRNI